MSTPTTAVATLPRYNHAHHYYPHSHHHHHNNHHQQHHHYHNHNHNHPHHQPPYPHHQSFTSSIGTVIAGSPTHSNTNSSSNNNNSPLYRSSAANSILPPPNLSPASTANGNAPGLLPLYQPQSATSGASAADGVSVALPQSTAPRAPPHDHRRSHLDHRPVHSSIARHDEEQGAGYTLANMPAEHDSYNSSVRKRRRSRETDWKTFYRNGLPNEIIVIDDTPEPEANTGRKVTKVSNALPSISGDPRSQQRPPVKRRRQDDGHDMNLAYQGYHVQYLGSHLNSPLQRNTPTGSTLSSEGQSSVVLPHNTATTASTTTAPTSLSPNGQYEEVQAPLKRKRTRQQAANEAKRRDVDGLGDPFFTYKPPPYPPKKASDVHVHVIQDRYHDKHHKVDDEDGHYIVVPDAELTERYQITRLLGQGTFGKVVQARDRRRNELVAVKIIRSVQKYRDASKIELRVLATLKANDEENRNRCIHLRDCFDYRGHICIVMNLLDQSVFDFLKGNAFVPFPNSQIQSFARQLFTSVAFLHDLNLIHTDLKPENILLFNSSYQTFTYNRNIPSSSTTINRQATQRRVLLDTEIRLIDFGSATFQDEYHSSVVSTRHYRAPEIILGLGWSYPCDIWSIGCILVEFFTGDALFQTHDNLEHLAMMEAVVGRRIDPHLIQAVNKMSIRNGGNPASKYFKRLKLDYPTPAVNRGSRRLVKAMKQLHAIIPTNTTFFQQFSDLLSRIFVYDPAQRITAKGALNHPWFQEVAVPDDGTEAAKIRVERRRMEEQFKQQQQHLHIPHPRQPPYAVAR